MLAADSINCGLYGFPYPLRHARARLGSCPQRSVDDELSLLGEPSFCDVALSRSAGVWFQDRTPLPLVSPQRAVVQGFINQVPTRGALHAWGYQVDAACTVCGMGVPDTMLHRALHCSGARR